MDRIFGGNPPKVNSDQVEFISCSGTPNFFTNPFKKRFRNDFFCNIFSLQQLTTIFLNRYSGLKAAYVRLFSQIRGGLLNYLGSVTAYTAVAM